MDQQRFGIQRERESSSFGDQYHFIENQVPKITAGQIDSIVKQFQMENEGRVFQIFYKDQGADLPLFVRCPKISEDYAMWAGFCFECGHDHEQKYFKSMKGNNYIALSKNYDFQVIDFQFFSRKLSEILIREINGLIKLKEEDILEKMNQLNKIIDEVNLQSNGLEFYKRFISKYSNQQKILKSLCSNNKLYPWYGYCTHCKENPPHQFYISFGGSQQPEQLPSSIKLKVVLYQEFKMNLINELKEHIWSNNCFLQWKQYINITSAQNERLGILSKIGSLEKSNNHYVQENQQLHEKIEELKIEKVRIQNDFEEQKKMTQTFESNKADHVFKGYQDHNTFYDIEINCESILQLTAGEGWEIKLNSQEYEKKLKCNTIVVSFYGLYNKGKTFLASKLSGKSLPLGYSVSTVGLSALYPQDLENENAIVFLDTAGTETPIQYQKQDEIVNQHLKELQANFEEMQDQKPHERKRQIYEIKLKDRLLTEHMIQKFILSESNIIFIIVDQLTKEEQRLVQKIKNLYEIAEIIIVHNLAKLVSLEDVEKYIKIDILESFEVKEQFRIFSEINLKGLCYVENRYDSQGTKLPDITHVVMAYDNSEAGKKYNQFCYHYLKNRILAVTKAKEFDLIKKLTEMIKQHLPEIIDLPAEKFSQLQLEFNSNKILTNLNSTSLKSISFDLLGDLKVFKGGLDPKYSIIITESELILEVELAGPFAPTERDLKQYEKKLIQCKETGHRMFEWHGFRKEGTDRMQYIVLRGIKKDLSIEGKAEILANVRERGEFRLIIPINPGICVLRDDSPEFVVINGVPQLRYILQKNDEIDDFF